RNSGVEGQGYPCRKHSPLENNEVDLTRVDVGVYIWSDDSLSIWILISCQFFYVHLDASVTVPRFRRPSVRRCRPGNGSPPRRYWTGNRDSSSSRARPLPAAAAG